MTCEKLISGLKKFGFCLTISKDMAQKYIGKIARCEKKQNKLIVFYDGKISDILQKATPGLYVGKTFLSISYPIKSPFLVLLC